MACTSPSRRSKRRTLCTLSYVRRSPKHIAICEGSCINIMFHPVINWLWLHDDVIKWKHFPRKWPFVRGIHRSPVNSPHKGQWRGALMFTLICARINGWVNNRQAGDLSRHRAHYDVIVMQWHYMASETQVMAISHYLKQCYHWRFLVLFTWQVHRKCWGHQFVRSVCKNQVHKYFLYSGDTELDINVFYPIATYSYNSDIFSFNKQLLLLTHILRLSLCSSNANLAPAIIFLLS